MPNRADRTRPGVRTAVATEPADLEDSFSVDGFRIYARNGTPTVAQTNRRAGEWAAFPTLTRPRPGITSSWVVYPSTEATSRNTAVPGIGGRMIHPRIAAW